MRTQAGCRNTGIHHVGLRATNPAASAEFYRDVLGVEIVAGSAPDHPLGATAFVSSRPDEESHEIALFADPALAHIVFKVSSLAEFRSFHARVVEKNIPIKFAFNHRVIELYWPTGDMSWRQPIVEYSDMVRSLVLVSGFSYGGDPRMRLQFDLWLHLARTDKIAFGKLLLLSGLSREFLSAFDENTINGIIQSFVAISDWPLIEQNIRVDLAVDVREQAKKIKAPTLSITGKYDQIVPPFFTQELADLIPTGKRTEIPSGHLSFLEKPIDLASAMLTFLLEKHP